MNKKVKNILAWVLQVLLGLQFLMAGGAKFIRSDVWMSMFERWGYPDGFYLVIGALEVVSAILLFIPKYAGYSAMVLIIIMIGAASTHIIHDQKALVDLILAAMLIPVVLVRKPAIFRKKIA